MVLKVSDLESMRLTAENEAPAKNVCQPSVISHPVE